MPVESQNHVDGRRARGDRTRQAILDRAGQIASEEGLEGLSIGRLAADLGVSKSGLFAHFGSKEELQVATVQAAREVFLGEVLGAARMGGGIDEVMSLTDGWLDYMEREVFRGGCFLIAAATEFDSRPGPVRDEIAGLVSEWLIALESAIEDAQDSGAIPREVSSQQLAFELHALGMGANCAFQLFRDREAFTRARTAIRQRLLTAMTASTAPASAFSTANPLADLERQLDGDPAQVEVDHRSARRTLREQIAKLEQELASLFPATRPQDDHDWNVGSLGGPRVLDVADLEVLRDQLAVRVEEIRRAMSKRAVEEQDERARLESLTADPAAHKWGHVSNDQIGEPGCKHYRATPRLGLVGMLMGWWRVKISSGCP